MNAAATICFIAMLSIPVVAFAGATPVQENDAAEAVRRELDRAPQTGEKPFAPADGAVAKLNPPAFVWLPLKKRPASYLVELSRSPKFADSSTLSFDAPISVHIPTQPLPTGEAESAPPGRKASASETRTPPNTWHWRVGVRLPDGSVAWGKARRFTVAPDAEQWPFPQMEALAGKVPKAHPRLFFPGGELQRVRQSLDGPMKAEYARLLRDAEKCIGEPLIAEPDFLRKTGTERGNEYAGIFRATRPPMDKMETCGLAYALSGERRFGDEAKRRLLHFFAWDPNGSTSLTHNDEPAMWVMQRGTRAYDWVYDLFAPEERAKVEPVMKARCEQFLKRLTGMPFESRPYSSHPARDVGFLGEAALCFIHEWPEARNWLEYVLKIYWSVFPAWAQDDGGWQEGPGYWSAYMSFALHFATPLLKATGENITRKPFFHNTPYYKLYTNPPAARMSPFGDGQHGPAGAGPLMYAFSTLLRDPYIRWYAEAQKSGPGSGAMGFALFDPSLQPKPPSDLPQARCFPGAGLVAMHTNLADPKNDVWLVMRSSPFGSISHGHADQNAFCIEAFGEALAIPSGYYPWYGSPHHESWTRETKAKNCITIDGGIGQTKRSWDASGKIARFVTNDKFDYALGDATAAYSGRLTKALRHVVHVRPSSPLPRGEGRVRAAGDGAFVIVDELE
ncbi:MAG: DUF4962 domain-containing protein, partial [Planctomycetes bacterium]|nr:DUF4962 domain-containing protein [Planctomycetota bacterium]